MLKNKNATQGAPTETSEESTDTSPDQGTTTSGSETTAEDDADTEDDDEESSESDPPKLSMTTKQLSERISRAKGKAQKELFSLLGVDNLEAAQELVTKAKQADLDKLSETERLRQEAEEAKKEAEKERKARERIERDREEKEAQEFKTNLLKSANVTSDAMELAQARLDKYIEENFDDDHEVTEKDLKPFFKTLKQEKKLWFEAVEVPAGTHGKDKNPPVGSAPSGRTFAAPDKPIDEMSPLEWEAYKRKHGLS